MSKTTKTSKASTAASAVVVAAAEARATEDLVIRLGKILSETATALKGPPPPRMMHSTHDLAEVASALVAKLATVTAERDRLLKREEHFASVLRVTDGGQYRNDWNSAIRRVLAERDDLRAIVNGSPMWRKRWPTDAELEAHPDGVERGRWRVNGGRFGEWNGLDAAGIRYLRGEGPWRFVGVLCVGYDLRPRAWPAVEGVDGLDNVDVVDGVDDGKDKEVSGG